MENKIWKTTGCFLMGMVLMPFDDFCGRLY
jgi:hypothetical protein